MGTEERRDPRRWTSCDPVLRACVAATRVYLQHSLLVCSMDSHGRCVSFFGPPAAAQTVALQELRADCMRFCARPTAFRRYSSLKRKNSHDTPPRELVKLARHAHLVPSKARTGLDEERGDRRVPLSDRVGKGCAAPAIFCAYMRADFHEELDYGQVTLGGG